MVGEAVMCELDLRLDPVKDNMTGGEWSFKNSGSRKILVEFHGSRSLVFWRLCASRSLVFYTKVSRSLDFLQD